MELDKVIEYWQISGQRAWGTSVDLLRLKRYDACLFYCHLAIEKLLKGLVAARIMKPAPYTHDLAKLAHLAELPVTAGQIKLLRIISTFNIAGRYDDIKFAFYKQCTRSYTFKHYKKAKEIFLWLNKQYPVA